MAAGKREFGKKKSKSWFPFRWGTMLVVAVMMFTSNIFGQAKIWFTSTNQPDRCPVFPKVVPSSYAQNDSAVKYIFSDVYRKMSADRLAGAVQVDTTNLDDFLPVAESPETWKHFEKFHVYLRDTFPEVFAKLDVEIVNTYGLVITWKGSKSSLKPLVLMAHQDVVPVAKDTVDDWTYPPFSGHYDGEFIHGRGASDCKNSLIATLESMDMLLSQGWTPKRTVIAAFGFDEETSGEEGAGHISRHLEQKYGQNGIYAIIDEGNGVQTDPMSKMLVGVPATAEKGYADIHVSLTMPGGHSSQPPDHTGIGIMGELAHWIEEDPYPAMLTSKNPFLQQLEYAAVHGKAMPDSLKKTILRSRYDSYANKKLLDHIATIDSVKYLVKTSQAIDIIHGGEKSNSLPEQTQMVINHRIAVESDADEVLNHFVERVKSMAKKHDLSVYVDDKKVASGTRGRFDVKAVEILQPAPRSPTDNEAWKTLFGTVRHVFEDLVFPDLDYPVITVPSIFTGNTDTRHMWRLTDNIYRFSPQYVEDPIKELKIHAVDERMPMDAHLQLVAWYYQYIQNVSEASE
ncbi:carboxypeptidase S [Diutina rugosa]